MYTAVAAPKDRAVGLTRRAPWRLVWAVLVGVTLYWGGFFVAIENAAAADTDPPVHIVEAGDTLSAIATRYGSSVAELVRLNQLADADRLDVGQRLVIPRTAAQVGTTRSGPALLWRYTVQPGDTVGGLARRWQLDERSLRQLNGMPDSTRRLLPGQEVAIPLAAVVGARGLAGLEIDPLTVVQGQAAALRVRTPPTATVHARYAGSPLTVVRDGELAWALFGVHPLTSPGTTWLHVDMAGSPLPPRLAEAVDEGWLHLSVPVKVTAGDYSTQHLVLPPAKGELLEPVRLADERARLNSIWPQAALPPQWTGVFTRPLSVEFPTTSPFGTRRSYNGGPVSSFHEGQDFGAPEGTAVLAPAPGQVVLAEELTVRGNAVIVDHGGGLHTGYWHLSKIDVQPGQEVKAGDKLGEVGTTGLSTGWHLHWEMRIGTTPVDPLPWLVRAFP